MKLLTIVSLLALSSTGFIGSIGAAAEEPRRLVPIAALTEAAYNIGRYMTHHPELFDKGVSIDHSTDSEILESIQSAIAEIEAAPYASSSDESDEETIILDTTNHYFTLMIMALQAKKEIQAAQ